MKITQFLKDGVLSPSVPLPEESQILEYKMWRDLFSHEKLTEIATIYCAFLNTTGGRLMLGVEEDKREKRGIVQGYEFSPEDIQSLKELLSFKHAKILPEPPAENYRLTFIPVEGGKYVISVEIKPGDKKTYYGRDSGHMSYINTRVWNESLQQCEEMKICINNVERKVGDENDPRVTFDSNPEFEFTFDDSFKFPEVEITKSEEKTPKNKHEKYQEEKNSVLANDLCRFIGKFSDQHLMQILGEFDKKEPYHALDIWCGLNSIEELQAACIAKLEDLLKDCAEESPLQKCPALEISSPISKKMSSESIKSIGSKTPSTPSHGSFERNSTHSSAEQSPSGPFGSGRKMFMNSGRKNAPTKKCRQSNILQTKVLIQQPPNKTSLISLTNSKFTLLLLRRPQKNVDYYLEMMGMQEGRPQSTFNKDDGHKLANYSPEASLEALQAQLEQLEAHLKEGEQYLQVDLAYLKKETGIDVKSPPSLFKNEAKPVTSQPVVAAKKEKVEERKSDDKDAQKKKQELSQENKNIHDEIIEFKDLVELMGGSTMEIGDIVALNGKSDSLEAFSNTNKSLRDQLLLASDLLKKAGVEQKIKSISCPKPIPKEDTKQAAPVKMGHWSEGKLEGTPAKPIKHVYKPLKAPVKDAKGQIILEKPVLFTLPGDIFEKKTLRIDLMYYAGVPEPDKKLGDPKKINEVKAEITPYANVWRSTVRNLISRYELVDIDRGNSRKRAIVKYRDRDDKDETCGVFPVFSRAYFKLWEVLDITGILDKYKGKPINIASLAEGPGGFLHCMIDWRKKQNGPEWNKDSYCAITLRNLEGKLDHECIDWHGQVNYSYWKYAQDKHSINLSYGAGKNGKEATGDLLQKENLEHFKNVDLKGEKCALVTADGGIHLERDDSYSLQEVANIKLFFAEALYALNVQEIGGSFVMKIYDIYFEITVELILLLAFYYEKITIFKPLTSRPANSEKYVIAEGFKGISADHLERLDDLFFGELFTEEKNRDYLKNKMFAQRIFDFDVHEEKFKKWKQDLAKGNDMNMKAQIEAIEYGLGIASVNFASVDKDFLFKKRKEQKEFCIAWCQRHGVPYIEDFRV